MPSYCPPGALSGIVQLVGALTQPQLQQIQLNTAPPIQFNIAPRTTAAVFTTPTSPNIEDTTNNFIYYKNNKYSIINVQVCNIQHTGYIVPGMGISTNQTSQAELIITCYNNTNSPEGVLLCLPIYQVSNDSVANNAYITSALQVGTPENNKYPTLDTLFIGQPSFSYQSCFQVNQSDNSIMAYTLQLYVFPKGIKISANDMNTLQPHLANKYIVPGSLRNNNPIITSSDYINNQIVIKNTSPNQMYTAPLQTITNEFINMFEYYLQDIPTTTSARTDTLYTTTQYKCMPFDPTKNLVETNGAVYVTPGKTNPTIATMIQQQQTDTTDTNMREDIVTYTFLGIGGIGACICLYFAYKVGTQ